ncbi:TIR domain-containing protein [Flammeovirgaceae bacterium SG7u.111]|nr:TIR domain-containing protein [Flammeovirgaceae bacterium SG7u.132]WPO36614.1 TIR domain-containing protein [Flammeovirgaceae bacterium SG7u.111]
MPDISNRTFQAFISYSRINLPFAQRLHDRLTAYGNNIWFDQEDIPEAVDFEKEIEQGIAHSHNFIFIISPDSIKSEYCQKEIEYALKYNKRIVPILYQEPGNLIVEMDSTVRKINWIYGREEDDFENALSRVSSLLERNEFVESHTHLLLKALEWRKHHRSTEKLLIGDDRKNAEEWLKQKFSKGQAPCEPTDLHCEYITESEKNAFNLMTEVFISHSTENKALTDRLSKSLMRHSYTLWINRLSIQAGTEFKMEIEHGIEDADNFVFLISPSSLASEYCQFELAHALKLNKRIITLLVEETPNKDIPEVLRGIQYIDCRSEIAADEDGYQDAIDKLIYRLDEDYFYYQQHKIFLSQALKWERHGKSMSLLLHGHNLDLAKSWLSEGGNRTKDKPTELHRRFITESQNMSGKLNIDVFISYSRSDSDFSRKINRGLQYNGKTTWFDQENIASGVDFEDEIQKGIEASDNFLFIISPQSITSPYCAGEVEHAVKHNKRIITIKHKEVDTSEMHPDLARLNWIDFEVTQAEYSERFSELMRTLDTDRDYLRQHTRISRKALDWELKDHDEALLLRGSEFILADSWMKEATDSKKEPQPTELMISFIEECKEHLDDIQKRGKRRLAFLRTIVILMSVFLLASVALTFYLVKLNKKSESLKIEAYEAKDAALRRQLDLEAQKQRFDSLQVIQTQLNAEFKKPTSQRNESLIRQLLNITDSISEVMITTEIKEQEEQTIAIQGNSNAVGEHFNGRALVKRGEKWGYLDEEKTLVIKAIYDAAGKFSEGKARVRVNGKWGYIDTNGNEVIPFVYDLADNFAGDSAKVRQYNTTFYISSNNTCLNNCDELRLNMLIAKAREKYPETGRAFSAGLLLVKQEGKWGYVNRDLTLIIPCKYEVATNFTEHTEEYVPQLLDSPLPTTFTAKVVENGTEKLIDTRGNCLHNCLTNPKNMVSVEGGEGIESLKIGAYEITNAEYANFLNATKTSLSKSEFWINLHPRFQDDQGISYSGGVYKVVSGAESKPVSFVSWYGASAYCKWAGGRLPSEEEWEFYAKGGTSSRNLTYGGTSDKRKIIWSQGAESKLTQVDDPRFQPNELGLFHISGNVAEWCSDSSGDGLKAVMKGGSLRSGINDFRPAARKLIDKEEYEEYFGFRMVKD